jgi:NADPH:quinone reductase
MKSAAPSAVPETMLALELRAYDGPAALSLERRPVQRPGRGELLVRMSAAPIGPADLMFMRGLHATKKRLRNVPGFEGSGVVVATGPGLSARFMLGRRVACTATPHGDGTWAEYMCTTVQQCVPLRSRVALSDQASMTINPFAACVMLDFAQRNGHRAFVQTAAAGALGRMVVRLARRRGVKVLAVVRRFEQAAPLRALGAAEALSEEAPDFEARLAEACKRHDAKLAFDMVGGPLTGRVLRALPPGGCVQSAGMLSREEMVVSPRDVVFEAKRIEGFYLDAVLRTYSLPQVLRMAFSIQRRITSDFETTVRRRVPLSEFRPAIADYEQSMSAGRILFAPELDS